MGNFCSASHETQGGSRFIISKEINKVKVNGTQISLVQGDILEESVGAIVHKTYNMNATPDHLLFRKSDAALIKEEIDNYINQNGPVLCGKACYTSAGSLRAKYIIHVSAPIWSEGTIEEIQKLAESYKECLKLAEKLNIKSLAFTEFAGILASFPKALNAEVLIKETFRFVLKEKARESSLKRIKFVIFDLPTLALYKKPFEKEMQQSSESQRSSGSNQQIETF